ncbi:MAG: CCA tRNA nucleotidyltransferase [Cognatishimia sp.]
MSSGVTVSGDWLTRPSTQTVCRMLEAAGFQALLVGGCVRNALLKKPVSDIDISTDARPDQVINLAKVAGLKAIPTGIDHGTITVVADDIAHEITTFRKDVETDGRRAVVAFSEHVEDDAHRRDFTMNALYARADGSVIDPLGGLADLRKRRFRFIDDAAQRIREDYLRILRYFRFHAWYGDASLGMDPEALAAIAAHSGGIDSLSKERVGAEMLKLLAAEDPAPVVATMRQCGVLSHIIEGADDRGLAPLVHMESALGVVCEPLRRLAVLGGQNVSDSLRLSKKRAQRLEHMRDAASGVKSAAELGYRFDGDLAVSAILLRSAWLEQPLPECVVEDAKRGSLAEFPVQAADLIAGFQGAALGSELRRLEALWIASGFTLSRKALLSK